MSWFEKPAEAPARVPTEAIWAVCPSCKAYIAKEAWRASDKVCPRCNHHERLACRERVASLTDAGSFKELNPELLVIIIIGSSRYKRFTYGRYSIHLLSLV